MKPFRLLVTKKIDPILKEAAVVSGITIVEHPFIDIKLRHTEELRDFVSSLLQEPHTVVFSSKHAVKAVAALSSAVSDTMMQRWTIYCMEGATQNEIKQYTDPERIAAVAEDSKTLASEISGNEDPGSIVFFTGNRRRDEIPDILTKKGFDVKEVVVYDSYDTPSTLGESFDGLAFFSPSAVSSYFSANSPEEDAICFAIGSTTAKALKKHCKNKIITADHPSEKALLNEVMKKVFG